MRAAEKLDGIGIDAICEKIIACQTLTEIAGELGVSVGSILAWVDGDSDRSARAREAREWTAKFWDEKAETGIANAADPFELSRAKELAHHYRWRASKIAPKSYGDKFVAEHSGPNGGAIPFETVTRRIVDSKGEK